MCFELIFINKSFATSFLRLCSLDRYRPYAVFSLLADSAAPVRASVFVPPAWSEFVSAHRPTADPRLKPSAP